MLQKRFFIKGQSLLEIVTLFAVASLVMLGIQIYIQRGIQGRTRDLTNIIIGSKQRFTASDDATSNESTSTRGTTRISTAKGGAVTKNINETTNTSLRTWNKGKP